MKKHYSLLLSVTLLCLVLFTACTADNVSETSSREFVEESAQTEPRGIWRMVGYTQLFPFAYTETYTYGENGLLLQTVTVYGEGERRETTVYDYDADGNLLLEMTTDQNGTEVAYVKQSFENGKLMSKTVLELGASRESTTLYSYDREGRLQKTERDGITESYFYHEDGGYTVEWSGKSGNGSYLYDASGNLLEIRHGDGELNEEYLYDEQGHLLNIKQYAAGEVTDLYRYQYDASGNLLSREFYFYGELQYTTLYEYDEHGNQIKTKQVADGKELLLSETEYEFFEE